jgi:hypothetical protein
MVISTVRRVVLAGVAGITVTGGVVVASASTIGGVGSGGLAAGNTVVAACDSDGVSIAYTNAYDATTQSYRTTAVTVSGIAAPCVGQTLGITLSGAAGAALASASGTVAGTSLALLLPSSAAADAVQGAAVVITG